MLDLVQNCQDSQKTVDLRVLEFDDGLWCDFVQWC